MNSVDEGRSEAVVNVVDAVRATIGDENIIICEGGCDSTEVCFTPCKAEDISKIIAIAKKYNVTVVTSNNPFRAVDGTKFAGGGILVDLSKMNKIIKLDTVAMTVKVGAGCIFKDLAEACSSEGFTLGSFPFNKAATVGSWAVSNTVGYGTYKYGNSKDNIVNLKVVTEDASIIETGYDNIGYYMSGYNLTQLFSASEGTLGVVTEATFKLFPKGIKKKFAFSFESIGKMQEAFTKIVQHPSILPRNIAWCAKNMTIVFALDGTQDSVDLEEQAIGEMMEKIPATKVDDCIASKVCEAVCKPRTSKKNKEVVPIKNWGELVSACENMVYGTIADRSTACVISDTDRGLPE